MRKQKKVMLAIAASALNTIVAVALYIIFFERFLQRWDSTVTGAMTAVNLIIFLFLLISLRTKRLDAQHRESNVR